jgi:hypothetical protein
VILINSIKAFVWTAYRTVMYVKHTKQNAPTDEDGEVIL